MCNVAVVIISDRAASGERPDGCLPVFREALGGTALAIVHEEIVSDEPTAIRSCLSELVNREINLVFTSGGTGCGPRDNTPEVTMSLLDRPTPGLDEYIRRSSMAIAPYAVFSRACSGVARNTFIVNLPGSPKAVAETLDFLLPIIDHPVKLVKRDITDCANEVRHDKLR